MKNKKNCHIYNVVGDPLDAYECTIIMQVYQSEHVGQVSLGALADCCCWDSTVLEPYPQPYTEHWTHVHCRT